jgi:hypothetical protein
MVSEWIEDAFGMTNAMLMMVGGRKDGESEFAL